MHVDAITRHVLGIDAYSARLAPWSAPARAHARAPVAFLARDWSLESQRLHDTSAWFRDVLDVESSRALSSAFGQLPDVDALHRHIQSQTPLREADCYTLKRALFYGITISKIADPLILQWTTTTGQSDIERAQALMAMIHPERQPSPRFLLSDALDEDLAVARKRLRDARRQMMGRRQEVESAIINDYPESSFDIQGRLSLDAPRDEAQAAQDGRLRPFGGFWLIDDEELTRRDVEMVQAQQHCDAQTSRVLSELSAVIHQHARWFERWMTLLLELDVRVAKVRLLQEIDGCWPQQLDSIGFELEAGADPRIKDAQRIDFNTTWSAPVVVTGPNMGGKSSLLKLVGLAHWCMRYLYPVPARCARFTPVESIIYIGADAQHDQSDEGLSSFGREVRRLVQCEEAARAPVCWLLDELGRGTHPEEGDRLAQEVVQHLGHAHPQSQVICATHFSGLARAAWAEHVQISGIDHSALPPRLDSNESHESMMRLLRAVMDYQPIAVETQGNIPRDARVIARLLGLDWLAEDTSS